MNNKAFIKSVVAAIALGAAPMAFGAPAVHVSDFGCGLLDGNGNFVVTTDTKFTGTFSANGNAVLKCKASVAPSTTGRAVRHDFDSTGGGQCGVFFPTWGIAITNQWHETVSASGEAMLTCHFPGKP